MSAKRLEYIDAMRGFTMLFVVFWHIIYFGYHGIECTFNYAFMQFRMPLFFFISGFVLYKAERVWDCDMSKSFLGNKFMVQIIPTVFFLVIFDLMFDKPVWGSFFQSYRNGYWFTISLFEYYVLFVIISVCKEKKYKATITVLYSILVFTTLTNTTLVSALLHKVLPFGAIANVFGLMYFPFFYFGTVVKKYFDRFCHMTDNGTCMAVVVVTFIASILFTESITSPLIDAIHPIAKELVDKVFFLINGILGIIIVFTFFRKKEKFFTKDTWLGHSLQYIGRRTLDVYLLHYFFLPRNLTAVGKFFNKNVNPSIEFFVTLAIAIMVVALSLCMSSILRLSPLLEHYLFGVKKKPTNFS